MQQIEHFLLGKRNDSTLCEDGWVVTPHFAAVVDGSTSKVAGRNGGRKAMELVTEALHTLTPDADKQTMLRHLTQVLQAHNPQEAKTNAAYRLTCSAVIFSQKRRVVWLVGDCQCRFEEQTFTHGKQVDEVLTRARCEAAHYLLQHGHTLAELRANDLARACILPALREQTNFQNDPNPYNPYRYSVLDGTPVDPSFVPELPIAPTTHQLILASDGYPQLFNTLAETEHHLKCLLEADPLCISQNPATKGWMEGNASFDDRCYLRLAID